MAITRPGFRLFLAGLWLLGLALAGPAGADERRAVQLELSGPRDRLDRVELALGDLLGRLPIAVATSRSQALDLRAVVEPPSSREPADVRVWVDVSSPDQATLYFTDASWERILIRRFPLTKDLDEVEREELAQIVRSAVEALLGGAKIGITREEARAELLPPQPSAPPPVEARPLPPRLEKQPPPPSWRLEPGAFYEGTPYAGALWQGPGLALDVGAPGLPSLGARSTLGYRAPILLEDEVLGVRLQALTARVMGQLAWNPEPLGLRVAAGPGLDLTHVQPRRVGDQGAPAPASWDPVPVLRGELGASLAFGALRTGLFAGAEGDWVATRHVAERDGAKRTLISPARIRPFFGVSLAARGEK
ncbi:MAG: hypothetical protein IPM35_35695 [Myxococcales bacterium]|nr:hypothetical protein [Myxococcales bacterium]